MNRRELLKATGAVIVSGKTDLLGFDLRPHGGGYAVFFDRKAMGKEFPDPATMQAFPPNTVFYPVDVPSGKTLDDAIRIFKEK